MVLIKDILENSDIFSPKDVKNIKKGMFYCDKSLEKMSLSELLFINMVKKNPIYLQNISIKTDEICKEAVRRFGYAIEYVENQTEEIALLAVAQNGLALEHVKPDFHTDLVITTAIKKNPLAFRFALRKTKELCLKAVSLNGVNLEFVPKEFIDDNMIKTALASNGWAIKFVEKQTPEYAMEAVLQNTEVSLQIDECIRDNNSLIKAIYEEHKKRLPFTY